MKIASTTTATPNERSIRWFQRRRLRASFRPIKAPIAETTKPSTAKVRIAKRTEATRRLPLLAPGLARRADDLLGVLVGVVLHDDEERVDHPGEVEKQRQQDVDDGLDRLAAHEHG